MEQGNTLSIKEFAEKEIRNMQGEINLLQFKIFDRLERRRVLEQIVTEVGNDLDKLEKMKVLLNEELEKLQILSWGNNAN